jgi:hypothetical protein
MVYRSVEWFVFDSAGIDKSLSTPRARTNHNDCIHIRERRVAELSRVYRQDAEVSDGIRRGWQRELSQTERRPNRCRSKRHPH